MSMFIINEGKVLSFSEFLMLESLGPVPIKFGINYPELNDNGIYEIERHINTFFKVGDYFYVVFLMKNGEIGFGVSDVFSTDLSVYHDDRKKTFSALKVLNGFIYVVLEIAKAEKIDKLQFSAASEGLSYIYDGIMENSVFLNKMKESGWNYEGKKNKLHVFKKL